MTSEAENKGDRTKMLEAELVPGVVLGGRYELLTMVARGGMGRVWVARAKGGRGFKRLLAIKTMLAMDYEEAKMEDMLFQEAKFASMIHHPNVVAVEDFGEHRGVWYIAMELVRGETLMGLIKATNASGGIPLKIAVNLIGQVCRGLQAAHDLAGEDGEPLGLIHRDVTPGNIIVTYGGVAKLLDFGIAKAATSAAMTQVGELKGKMAYIAPETLLQQQADRRVDIFAVGVMLYLATTGIHPFREAGGSSNEVLARIVSDKPPISPTDLTDLYPEALEKVVMKALEKNRDRRYSSAEELLEELTEAVPEAFEPGVEKEIQEYLENLLSERISETTAQIRAAEELAEQSFPDISGVQVRSRPPEAPAEKPADPMREIMRALLLVLGIIFVPMGIFMVVALKLWGGGGEKEVVEKTVYLPGEVRTVIIPSSASAPPPAPEPPPSAAAPRPAPHAQAPKKPTEKSDLWVPAPSDPPAVTALPKSGLDDLWVQSPSSPPVPIPAPATAATVAPRPATVGPAPKKLPFDSLAPAGPKSLSSADGHRRLVINPQVAPYRPKIPSSLENMGPFNASVKMCVGTSGAPTSVAVKTDVATMTVTFRNAMMQWRYKPLLEGATAVPFCYSFQYEVR